MGGVGGQPAAAIYEIRLDGRLELHWSSWFGGLALVHDDSTTTLTGLVPDQAALHGLLGRVRDLGVPLLSVTRLDAAPNQGLATRD